MTYKEEFTQAYGHSYEAFRHWLKKDKGLQLGLLSDDERYALIPEFLNERRAYKFEEKNGFSKSSFISYLRSNYKKKISELTEVEYDFYLEEYTDIRTVKAMGKDDIISILERYVRHAETGKAIELNEWEVPFVKVMEKSC